MSPIVSRHLSHNIEIMFYLPLIVWVVCLLNRLGKSLFRPRRLYVDYLFILTINNVRMTNRYTMRYVVVLVKLSLFVVVGEENPIVYVNRFLLNVPSLLSLWV